MAATKTYQVTLRSNGINTVYNVFGFNPGDAVNNARRQSITPSAALVSVNLFSTCSSGGSNVYSIGN